MNYNVCTMQIDMIEFWKQPENKQHDWIDILEEI